MSLDVVYCGGLSKNKKMTARSTSRARAAQVENHIKQSFKLLLLLLFLPLGLYSSFFEYSVYLSPFRQQNFTSSRFDIWPAVSTGLCPPLTYRFSRNSRAIQPHHYYIIPHQILLGLACFLTPSFTNKHRHFFADHTPHLVAFPRPLSRHLGHRLRGYHGFRASPRGRHCPPTAATRPCFGRQCHPTPRRGQLEQRLDCDKTCIIALGFGRASSRRR
jgi:hypothetical protein